DLEGPFGVGLTTIEVGNDDYCRQPGPEEAGAVMGRAIPLPMLRKSFQLSIRRVSAYVMNGQPLDLSPAQDAAEAVANREEEMIYSGQSAMGLAGLLTIEGHQQVPAATGRRRTMPCRTCSPPRPSSITAAIAAPMRWRWRRRSTTICSGSSPAATSWRSSICGGCARPASTR